MSPVYTVEFTRKAARQFKKLSKNIQVRISSQIDKLSFDPRLPGSKKLTGQEEIYRIRVGDYRVLYKIEEDKLVILVVEVGHRREIYRSL